VTRSFSTALTASSRVMAEVSRARSGSCGSSQGSSRTPSNPGQHRSWNSVRVPDFAAKATQVLDLYAGVWEAIVGIARLPQTWPLTDRFRCRTCPSPGSLT